MHFIRKQVMNDAFLNNNIKNASSDNAKTSITSKSGCKL